MTNSTGRVEEILQDTHEHLQGISLEMLVLGRIGPALETLNINRRNHALPAAP